MEDDGRGTEEGDDHCCEPEETPRTPGLEPPAVDVAQGLPSDVSESSSHVESDRVEGDGQDDVEFEEQHPGEGIPCLVLERDSSFECGSVN